MKQKKSVRSGEQYCCPLCNQPLFLQYGDQTHPEDSKYGLTLSCRTPSGTGPGQCSAQAVEAWGRNADDAFEVIIEKYTGRRTDVNET